MWTMLFLLWMIPLAIAILAFARTVDGMPALKEKERELLFDETKETQFGLWLALKFVTLAVLFFLLGLVQGIVLPNLSNFWFVVVPLLTGSAAILLVAVWLRSARPHSRKFQTRFSRISRIADTLFR